jgi:hypothetical protein
LKVDQSTKILCNLSSPAQNGPHENTKEETEMKIILLCLVFVFLILTTPQLAKAQGAAGCPPIADYQKPAVVEDTPSTVYFDAIPVKIEPETITYAFTFRRQLPPPTDPLWKAFHPGYSPGVEKFDRTSKLWSFHVTFGVRYDDERAFTQAMTPLAALWKVEVRPVPSNRATPSYWLRDLLIPKEPPQDPGKIKP